MHYYKRNLGDYAKKAGRLSMLQHGSYTLLIDACYDREQFPTLEEAIEWTWASTKEEIEAVEFVLRKFFVLEDGRYIQNRIEEEIAEYNEKSLTNKRIANEREAKRKENITKREPVVNESSPNHKPITNNHKPVTNKKPSAEYSAEFEQAWSAYPRFGDTNKKASYKAWKARLNAGADPEQMIAGVNRYAFYCYANGTEQKFIKQPQTFFGADKHYESEWPVQKSHSPPRKTSVQDARLDTIQQIFGGAGNGNDRQIIDITPTVAIEGGGASIPKIGLGVRQPDVG